MFKHKNKIKHKLLLVYKFIGYNIIPIKKRHTQYNRIVLYEFTLLPATV